MTVLDELEAAANAQADAQALRDKRDQLIVQAREERYSWEEIMKRTGLTRQAAYTAYQRAKN